MYFIALGIEMLHTITTIFLIFLHKLKNDVMMSWTQKKECKALNPNFFQFFFFSFFDSGIFERLKKKFKISKLSRITLGYV